MFLMSLHYLQRHFPTCLIINVLFKSTLKLNLKKNQNIKRKKNQNLQRTKYEKKKLKDQLVFLACLVTKFAWGPRN
jgi:hypothetical protein